jgi:GntR family transcriptional regulator/MocR family aminotransferase
VLHHDRQHELIRRTRHLADHLDLSASDGGLHLLGRLAPGRDDRAVARNAVRLGVHVWPLSSHYLGASGSGGLLLGYAGTPPEDMGHGVEVLGGVLAG